jgi:hypothetical protein
MTPQDSQRQITALNAQVDALSAEERARFDRLFHVSVTTGQTVPPAAMHPWIEGHFGSVEAVRQQRIVKVTNLVTLEGALFNELRARRPFEAPTDTDDLEETIRSSAGGPFCQPQEGTPADAFGRIQGQYASTASNVAKYDGWHGVIIFDEHHPLRFTAEQVADYIDTAQQWARAAHQADPEACYPFFLWNCLWRSGASILHGHAQMTLSRGMHYAQVERWRQAAVRYQAAHGTNYFADLIAVHRSLDLALDYGAAAILPSLTPFKEKETDIIAPDLDADLESAIFLVLSTFVERLGVQSFNLALYQPPLVDRAENWDAFPFVVRIIDRGNLHSKTADIGAMEMFGQSVVASDPFRLADALLTSLLPAGGTEGRHRGVS